MSRVSKPSETERSPKGINAAQVTIITGTSGGVLKKIAIGFAAAQASRKQNPPSNAPTVLSSAMCSSERSRKVTIMRGMPNSLICRKKGKKITAIATIPKSEGTSSLTMINREPQLNIWLAQSPAARHARL